MNNKGQRHGSVKLTNEDVLEIRRLWTLPKEDRPKQMALAIDYNITIRNVQKIIKREIWKHI